MPSAAPSLWGCSPAASLGRGAMLQGEIGLLQEILYWFLMGEQEQLFWIPLS